jgi:hypothetical protein
MHEIGTLHISISYRRTNSERFGLMVVVVVVVVDGKPQERKDMRST